MCIRDRLCLDVTEAVLDEAIALGYNLVISHHPLIFKGYKSITGRDYVERCIIGQVRKVTLEGSDARFDHTLVPHGHGRCRECGRVCDIFLADFAAIGRDAVCGGFQVEGWDVEFTGLCEECSKKQMRQGAKEE